MKSPKSALQLGSAIGLHLHMAASIGLLVCWYAAIVAVLIVIGIAPLLAGVLVAMLFGGHYALAERLMLGSLASQTRPSGSDDQRFVDAVLRVSELLGVSPPEIRVIDSVVPNALAVGTSSRRGKIIVTSGLLRLPLTPLELESIAAHEMAHLLHRDPTIMVLAGSFGALAALLFHRAVSSTKGSVGIAYSGERSIGIFNPALFALPLVAALNALSLVVIGGLARYREFAADRGCAVITNDPTQLSSAIQKVQGYIRSHDTGDLRRLSGANSLMFCSVRCEADTNDQRFTCYMCSYNWYAPPVAHLRRGETIRHVRCPSCHDLTGKVASKYQFLSSFGAVAVVAQTFLTLILIALAQFGSQEPTFLERMWIDAALLFITLGVIFYVWTVVRPSDDLYDRAMRLVAMHPSASSRIARLADMTVHLSR